MIEVKRKSDGNIARLHLSRAIDVEIGNVYQGCKNFEEIDWVYELIVRKAKELQEFYKSEEGEVYLSE